MSNDSSLVNQVIHGPRNRLLPAPQSHLNKEPRPSVTFILDARLVERLDVNLRNALVGDEPFGCSGRRGR
ncbi:hypothetical protein K525DRAFT_188035 [Schizophyllum commune Loenen D]|nr:hypothetical protein K525DRAFT_188035 [Schizophyllum commune Loenen D]